MIRRTFLKGAAAVSFSLMVSPALTAFAKDSVRVYVGGPIFTMNKNNDIAEAIAVKGETILAVGKKAEVMAAAGSGATVVDLKGKALIPGMIDGICAGGPCSPVSSTGTATSHQGLSMS